MVYYICKIEQGEIKMPFENKVHELLNILRGKHDLLISVQEIEVLSFFAYKTISFEINFSQVDFSNHHKFNDQVLAISDQCDEITSGLIKDIIVSGVLQYCEELNEVFKMLLKMSKDEIFDLYVELSKVNAKSNDWYTDDSLCDLFVELTKNVDAKNILDICSGKGSLLFKYLQQHYDSFAYGYELNYATSLVSRLKLNLLNTNNMIKNANVLSVPMENKYDLVYCHYPWGMRSRDEIIEDINGIMDYSNISRNRLDWAFIIKAVNSINKNGKAIVLIPAGALFSTTDIDNRKNIVEKGLIEKIISFPAGSLASTGVSYYMLVLSYGNEKIRYIDASNSFEKQYGRKKLLVKEIVDLVNSQTEQYVKEVTLEEVAKKDYNLSIGQYLKEDLSTKLINPTELSQLAEIITGYQYTSKTLEEMNPGEGSVDIVKITNIEDGTIDYDNLISAKLDDLKLDKYLLKDNDIIVSNKGSNPKLAFIKKIGDKKIIPHSNLTIIRVTSNLVNPLYLYAYLSSDSGINSLRALIKGAVVIANINRKDFSELLIPVLEKDDQDLICTRYTILRQRLNELNQETKRIKEKLSSIYDDKVGE